MHKDVIVSIHTENSNFEGEITPISLMTDGKYTIKGGVHYITYEETELSGFAGCNTTVKVKGGEVSILRFGPSNTQFVLEQGKITSSYYETPHGGFQIRLIPHVVKASIVDGAGDITLEYDLQFDEKSHMSNKILINFKEKRGTQHE